MLTLAELRKALTAAVSILEERFPGPIYTVCDLHEVDGQIEDTREVSWLWLHARLASDEALFGERIDVALASLGIFGKPLEFYLRISILDEDEDERYPGRYGGFDITATEPTFDYLYARVGTVVPVSYCGARLYFARRSALDPL